MARANTATLDGLVVGYGARDTKNAQEALVHTMGRIKHLEVHLDHSTITNMATSTAVDGRNFGIPSGANVKRVVVRVDEAFDSAAPATDTVIVGTKQSDGTTIDNDGLVASTTVASFTAGATIEGAGALVDGDALSATSYISVDPSATLTAGAATLLIEYIEDTPSTDAPDVITTEV